MTTHDLSVALRQNGMESREIALVRTSHDEAARELAREHGIKVSCFPDSSFFASERVTLGSHDGTHLDAPYHFYPTSEGRPAKLIDEWPLERCMGPGVRLDFRHKKPAEAINEYDIAAELDRIGHTPVAGEVLMLWTGGTDGFDYDPKFSVSAAGLNGGALNYVFRFGVRLMSTDSATIDMPIAIMRERFLAGDATAYFPIHRAGRLTEWTHAEKLANMSSLPGPSGYTAMLFPVKIAGGTGAWIRAVGIEDEALAGGMELVDLSLPIMNASFEWEQSRVTTVHHDQNRRAKMKEMALPPERIAHTSAMDIVDTHSHAGTHVDAPLHFAREIDGRPARAIDQLPLDWFYKAGVLLDFSRSKLPGDRITLADLRGEIDRLGARVDADCIPLIRTGAADQFANDPAYPDLGMALDSGAFSWLLDQGVKVIGCDAESLDGPRSVMIEALRSGRSEDFYPLHYLGRRREFCLIEQMDLSKLPGPTGFKIAAFPIKLEGASASWTRAVALFPKAS